jgi:hypothetical protein
MNDAQQKLNAATKKWRRLIDATDALAAEAKAAADQLCAEQNFSASAQVRAIEACARMAAGMLTEGYAKGRAMQFETGGVIVAPQGGGKD